MKQKLILVILFLNVFYSSSGQETEKRSLNKKAFKENTKCNENSDNLYNRSEFLEKFAAILNTSIPEFEEENGFKFSTEKDKTKGFGVYDLVDTSNSDSGDGNNCVNLINKHIYHVVPVLNAYSFSHLIFLHNGNMKVFKSVNCKEKGDTIDNVLNYIKENLEDENKSEILERIKNYRKYGKYIRVDNFSRVNCREVSVNP